VAFTTTVNKTIYDIQEMQKNALNGKLLQIYKTTNVHRYKF